MNLLSGTFAIDDAEFREPYNLEILSVIPNLTRPCHDVADAMVEAIGHLESGWDGYDALPISLDVCTNARRFLAASPSTLPAPEITPTSNGTINFEWSGYEADAYLEIGRTRFSGHIQPRGGKTIYLRGSLNDLRDSGINQALALISGILHGSSAPSLSQGIEITQPIF